MKVIFVREFKDDDGNEHRPGTVREVPDEVGKRLISEGVARIRKEERSPTETKKDDESSESDDISESDESDQ